MAPFLIVSLGSIVQDYGVVDCRRCRISSTEVPLGTSSDSVCRKNSAGHEIILQRRCNSNGPDPGHPCRYQDHGQRKHGHPSPGMNLSAEYASLRQVGSGIRRAGPKNVDKAKSDRWVCPVDAP